MNMNYEKLYGISLLDDLHNFFPDILYNNRRFNTVRDLLQYISSQTRDQFNLYNRGLRQHSSISSEDEFNFDPFSLRRNIPRTTTPARPPPTRVNVVSETIDITPMFGPSLGSGSTDDTNFLSNLLNLLQQPQPRLPDSVIVSPTQEQINIATQIKTGASEDSICSICQDNFAINQIIREIKHCEHIFHKPCIDHWFEQHVHCPVCRFDIRDHDESNS
jgi:hypothetical protein